MRSAGFLVLLWLLPARLPAQSQQEFQVVADSSRVTVGDTVTLRFRVRLDERDLLIDTIPRPIGPLPPGVRLLSVEKMHRSPDRIFHGQARLAFYRPGRQPVPLFGLPFMRIVEGVERATLPSDSAYVKVVPVLPAGNPALKDIREIDVRRGFPPGLLAAAALLVAGLLLIYRRLRRPLPTSPAERPIEHELPVSPADPFSVALETLLAIEREKLPERDEMARHYERIVDALRDYLQAAVSIPAREQTTAELLWALPPGLSEHGIREQFRELLLEADLVKFARVRPDAAAAHRFLIRSRSVLNHWHTAELSEAPVDALR